MGHVTVTVIEKSLTPLVRINSFRVADSALHGGGGRSCLRSRATDVVQAQVRCPMQRTPGYHYLTFTCYGHSCRLLRAHLLYISLPIVAYYSARLWGL